MTFNIGAAQDENEKDIIPSGKLVNSLVLGVLACCESVSLACWIISTPEQFKLKLTLRSMKHKELIRDSL
ncbi:hypothetical protein B0J17DRAFT_649557 [Rhizoctonia solani]|nr:hypothetical protein B0J17DRAFT_649557 [Rhizoctonia solani]